MNMFCEYDAIVFNVYMLINISQKYRSASLEEAAMKAVDFWELHGTGVQGIMRRLMGFVVDTSVKDT
jgi:hypothetical protein